MPSNHQLTPKLKSLRLSGILETLELRTQQAITEQLSYGDFLQRLVEDEVERRGQKQLDLRLRRAALDQTKTLESFDFSLIPRSIANRSSTSRPAASSSSTRAC